MPLGLSLEARRSVVAARVLTLTPHGQSLNNALDLVLYGVVNSAVNGIQVMDPYGRRVRIFIDPVAFFGDYSAVYATADVLGYTVGAFRTLCEVKRRKCCTEPEIMYSTEIQTRRDWDMFSPKRGCAPYGSLKRIVEV
ncbi:unnamed protein product [Agarophyton chilense]